MDTHVIQIPPERTTGNTCERRAMRHSSLPVATRHHSLTTDDATPSALFTFQDHSPQATDAMQPQFSMPKSFPLLLHDSP